MGVVRPRPFEPMSIDTLFTGFANTFLLTGEHGVVVVDAGMPHQAARILRAVRAAGYKPAEVRLILLTHGHIDHAGSAAALRRLTGAPIALHRADAALVATPGLKMPPARTRNVNRLTGLIRKLGWLVPLETFVPDLWLDEFTSLREFGLAGRIVSTPGHTAGSITLALSDGTCLVGDAVLNLVRVSFPLWWEDPAAARESARKIQALRPRVLYTGHGRPFDAAALDDFVAKISQYEEKPVQSLSTEETR